MAGDIVRMPLEPLKKYLKRKYKYIDLSKNPPAENF